MNHETIPNNNWLILKKFLKKNKKSHCNKYFKQLPFGHDIINIWILKICILTLYKPLKSKCCFSLEKGDNHPLQNYKLISLISLIAIRGKVLHQLINKKNISFFYI